MTPEDAKRCDDLLDHPLLRTPPPEPEKPKPERVRRPRVWQFPPKFPLLTDQFYDMWCNHVKQLSLMRAKVDDHPPPLFPDLYLKPRQLNIYGQQLEINMKVNKELLKRINMIQRNGGFVDCWNEPITSKRNLLMCQDRQKKLDTIAKENCVMYKNLQVAHSQQPSTKELDEMWLETKNKLILGAQQPFILFKRDTIDRGMKDPAFEKHPDIYRPRVALNVVVRHGSKIGEVVAELFMDIARETCQLFLSLIKGDYDGYGYHGTKIFRVVPNLYCCAGDVIRNNGFGMYIPKEQPDGLPMKPEGFLLKHSLPGVLSMIVTDSGEVSGQFMIIFKPLPQFDGKHVVFGRILQGPAVFLERISAMGRPLGTTSNEVYLKSCGWYTRRGVYREGAPNTKLAKLDSKH